MARDGASFWRGKRWLMWVAGGLLAAVVVAAGIVAVLLHRAEPLLRARIVEELQSRFHARVELDSFHMSMVDGLWAEGKGLRIWPPAQVEGVTVPGTVRPDEPLIRLEEFRFHAPLRYVPGKPFHISLVELKGLDVHMPPRSHFGHVLVGTGDAGQSKGVPAEVGAGAARGCCASRWTQWSATGRVWCWGPASPPRRASRASCRLSLPLPTSS